MLGDTEVGWSIGCDQSAPITGVLGADLKLEFIAYLGSRVRIRGAEIPALEDGVQMLFSQRCHGKTCRSIRKAINWGLTSKTLYRVGGLGRVIHFSHLRRIKY